MKFCSLRPFTTKAHGSNTSFTLDIFHIEGLKMSKSLKNFITIREALFEHSARQIRLLFISKAWDNTMNYTKAALNEIRTKEKTINEFFLTVKNILRGQTDVTKLEQKWAKQDSQLYDDLLKVQEEVDLALKDNFNTPKAFEALLHVINRANLYIKQTADNTASRRSLVLRKIAEFVFKILKIFGVIPDQELSFEEASVSASAAGLSKADILAPYLDVFTEFRTQIRNAAKAKKEPVHFLELCSEMRDKSCPPLGLRLEDETEAGQRWKLVDAAQYLRELETKRLEQIAQKKTKLTSRINILSNEIDKLESGVVEAKDLFSKEEFSQFDDKGIPTHDKEGKEIAKGPRKNLVKKHETHAKNQKAYQDAIAKDPQVLNKKKTELQAAKDELQMLG
eukprot:TRINITY_DN2822_c0_g1_i2.p2 TRINITY_DN2822_c0_g1~~TRINITY_DN2822_c0_g1_i2.p2  ORF type:complete len:394 (-),score=167.88 TRINITY_DN2822_c0_g1_i2:82-1263(-)